MTWLEVALVAMVLLGVFAGVTMVARSPSFWVGLFGAMWSAALPQLVRVVTKRMDPETEAAWRACQRRGGTWDHRTKRCK